jgi:F0F1-type ATP synthase epsilon subunit
MKVFVVHDATGTITSYAIPAPGMEGTIGIAPEHGQKVTEIDLPELDAIGDGRERLRRLDETLHERRIEGGKLVR